MRLRAGAHRSRVRSVLSHCIENKLDEPGRRALPLQGPPSLGRSRYLVRKNGLYGGQLELHPILHPQIVDDVLHLLPRHNAFHPECSKNIRQPYTRDLILAAAMCYACLIGEHREGVKLSYLLINAHPKETASPQEDRRPPEGGYSRTEDLYQQATPVLKPCSICTSRSLIRATGIGSRSRHGGSSRPRRSRTASATRSRSMIPTGSGFLVTTTRMRSSRRRNLSTPGGF